MLTRSRRSYSPRPCRPNLSRHRPRHNLLHGPRRRASRTHPPQTRRLHARPHRLRQERWRLSHPTPAALQLPTAGSRRRRETANDIMTHVHKNLFVHMRCEGAAYSGVGWKGRAIRIVMTFRVLLHFTSCPSFFRLPARSSLHTPTQLDIPIFDTEIDDHQPLNYTAMPLRLIVFLSTPEARG